jgi:hypothetical protein
MVGQKNQIEEEYTNVINAVHIYIEDMINITNHWRKIFDPVAQIFLNSVVIAINLIEVY